jgi:hypothetical protein
MRDVGGYDPNSSGGVLPIDTGISIGVSHRKLVLVTRGKVTLFIQGSSQIHRGFIVSCFIAQRQHSMTM